MNTKATIVLTLGNGEGFIVAIGPHKTYKITTYYKNEFKEVRKFYKGVYVYSFNQDSLYIEYKDGYERPDYSPSSLPILISEIEEIEEMEEENDTKV